MALYCRNQHLNVDGSRFCYICGDPLQSPTSQALMPGMTIDRRYEIVRELGHGGFGRTYLAVDLNRFREPCVLKEFAPQVQGTQAVQKASQLFEREAGVLYQLNHPQVPRFRELLRVQLPEGSKLFLVQDFVEGQTYQTLLNDRLQGGYVFSEAEILQLLRQLLPVLAYLHSLGVVHRDISPDNLIQRQSDGLPVLIDFGGVKQLAATVESALASDAPPVPSNQGTRLGKVGYAPEEQIRLGIAYPHSDLYALGVTMLVLLTGREPPDLLNPQTLEWEWQQYASVSPALAELLSRILERQPSDRIQSAQQVLQALDNANFGGIPPTQPPSRQASPPPDLYGIPPTQPPQWQGIPNSQPDTVAQPPAQALPPFSIPAAHAEPSASSSNLRGFLLGGVVILAAGIAGWWAMRYYQQPQSVADSPQLLLATPTSSPSATPSPPTSQFSSEEQARKQALEDRRRQLAIDNSFFVQLVNQEFYAANPDLKGRQLTISKDDDLLREQWDQAASRLLTQLEQISPESRRQLGNYSKADRDRWRTLVNQQKLSTRALYDLTDARFFSLFPNYRGTSLSSKPIEQVWHGVAADQVTAIVSGQALELVEFAPSRFDTQLTGTLSPGDGRAYIAYFSKGQLLRLTWQTEAAALISLYPPRSNQKPMLEDTQEKTWAGQLTESGYYEVVIVADAGEPVEYRIDLAVDNVSTLTSPN